MGHCPIGIHTVRMGIFSDPHYRSCLEEERKSSKHVFMSCRALGLHT